MQLFLMASKTQQKLVPSNVYDNLKPTMQVLHPSNCCSALNKISSSSYDSSKTAFIERSLAARMLSSQSQSTHTSPSHVPIRPFSVGRINCMSTCTHGLSFELNLKLFDTFLLPVPFEFPYRGIAITITIIIIKITNINNLIVLLFQLLLQLSIFTLNSLIKFNSCYSK